MHRRRALSVRLIVSGLALAAGLGGCGGAGAPATSPSATSTAPATSPSPTLSGDAPPAWVQNEALWEAMYDGDPDPTSMRWAVTTLGRASRLLQNATEYRTFYSQPTWAHLRVYAVVESGDFTVQDQSGHPPRARELLLILDPETSGGSVRAADYSTTGYDLSGLDTVHAFTARPPVTAGVWGQTTWSGGPFPGTGGTIAHVDVQVYEGRLNLVTAPSATPVATVVSDADGFFTIGLDPGTYTFLFRRSNWGGSSPWTVDVKSGQAAAVPVDAGVP